MTYTLVRGDEAVGQVSFDPFEYNYDADPENPRVREALEETSVMLSPNTAAPEGGEGLAAESFEQPPPEARESALRRALNPTDHELVSDGPSEKGESGGGLLPDWLRG